MFSALAAWPPTRAAALARLDAFTPRMGRPYAARRNYDLGPGDRRNVSLLSPYLRRRLVTEREVVRAALDAHGRRDAEKLVQEVFWRTYWKGWLEMRPQLWRAYRAGVLEDRARHADDRKLADAEAGQTGLACFDTWHRELVETGYLHNHARMWFASIWIFTLGLPWRLGADLFLRHLLDGDPASNTLSWRWVAGLQTPGKTYGARAANIAKYTEGRFWPQAADLAEDPAPVAATEGRPPALPLAPEPEPDPTAPTALLITEEDGRLEDLDLGPVLGAATLEASEARSDRPPSEAVRAFEQGALEDAAARAGAGPVTALMSPEDLVGWAARLGARQIVTAYLPVGPARDRLDAARPALEAAGVRVVMIRRRWDERIWPEATHGFFRVKKQIPRLLDDLGL